MENKCQTSHLEHTNTPWVHFSRTAWSKFVIKWWLNTFSGDGASASHDVSHHIIQCRVDQELCETSVVQKFVFHKNVSEPLLRPPANFLCSLLLFLLCWFNGADLVFLISFVLIRHVWVFNLWSCTRRSLYFRVISGVCLFLTLRNIM